MYKSKNNVVNDSPLYRCDATADTSEISTFRGALPQFITVTIVNILLFLFGVCMGFPTIVIPALRGDKGNAHNDIILSREQISWFSSLILLTLPFGCLLSGSLTQLLGKKRTLQFVNLPMSAAWLISKFAKNATHLYISLGLIGISGGILVPPVLTYIGEISEPKYRGILTCTTSVSFFAGVLIEFVLGSLMYWRNVAAVSATFPIITIILFCFVPESPIWLIREHRFHEAVKSLQWLRGWASERHIETEYKQLYEQLITQPEREATENDKDTRKRNWLSSLHMFRKRTFVVPFILLSFAFFVKNFSGKSSLQTYAIQIFESLRTPINEFHATILLGAAQLISTTMSTVLIRYTGKRPLVFVSTLGTGLCFLGTGTYAYFLKDIPGLEVDNSVINSSSVDILWPANITNIFAYKEDSIMSTWADSINTTAPLIVTNPKVGTDLLSPKPQKHKNLYLTLLPLVLLIGAAFFPLLGVYNLPWILMSEVFPADIRSSASGIVGGFGYFVDFLAIKMFLPMESNLTLAGTFWFYSGVAFFGALVFYFTLPETEGRTLAEIEAHFSKKTDANLFHKSNLPKASTQIENVQMMQADNLQHISVSPQTEGKSVHLELSETPKPMLPQHRQCINGEINSGYEENNTISTTYF